MRLSFGDDVPQTIHQTAPVPRADCGDVSGVDDSIRSAHWRRSTIVSRALAFLQQSGPKTNRLGLSSRHNSHLFDDCSGITALCVRARVIRSLAVEGIPTHVSPDPYRHLTRRVLRLRSDRPRWIPQLARGLKSNRAASVAQSRSMRELFCERDYAALVCVQTRSLSGSMPQRLPTASRSGFKPQ